MTRRRHMWTFAELKTLRELYPNTKTSTIAAKVGHPLTSCYRMACHLGLVKTQAYLESADACRLRRGDKIGAAYQFKKGHVPANKGTRRPGYSAGAMKDGWFKKGHRNEGTVHAYCPIGTERVNSYGYLDRKVSDTGRGAQRWRAVHLLMWEEKHGPIPAGHRVVFRDGDKTHVQLENLELVTLVELMRRNSYHTRYPKEVGLAIAARARLVRVINERGQQREKQDRRST